jgi:hypothetical protein
MEIAYLVSSGKMVNLKGGGLVDNGASRGNILLNNFSLSDCDNTWY